MKILKITEIKSNNYSVEEIPNETYVLYNPKSIIDHPLDMYKYVRGLIMVELEITDFALQFQYEDVTYEILNKVKQVLLFTSGQFLIFDKENNQIPELQRFLSKSNAKKPQKLLKMIANKANSFIIGKFRGGWSQELTKDEFLNITNCR